MAKGTTTGNGSVTPDTVEQVNRLPDAKPASPSAKILAAMAKVPGKASASCRKQLSDGSVVSLRVQGNSLEQSVEALTEAAKRLGFGDVSIRSPKDVDGFLVANQKRTTGEGFEEIVQTVKSL